MADVVAELFTKLTGRQVQRGETARDGRTLRWVRMQNPDLGGTGERVAPVVLECGLGEPLPTWVPLIGGLARIAPVVAYERAGIGASDPFRGPVTGRAQLADLAAVVESTGSAPCVLVGHSAGGWLGQALAWRRPELVAGLVLIDPFHEAILEAVPPEMKQAQDAYTARFATMTARDYIASNTDGWASAAARYSEDSQIRALIVDAWRASYPTDSRVRIIYEEETASQQEAGWAGELRRTGTFPPIPGVVLSATTGLPDAARAAFTGLQAEVAQASGATHVSVPAAGHYIHYDQPQAVLDAVRRVLALVRRGHGQAGGGALRETPL